MQRIPRSPVSPGHEGFISLQRSHSSNSSSENQMPGLSIKPGNEEHIVDIPLTPIRTNASTGARKEGQSMGRTNLSDSEAVGEPLERSHLFHRHRGRRRAKTGAESLEPDEEDAITTMGRFYDKVLGFSIITRYLLYILPLALCFLVVILTGRFAAKDAEIGGVKIYWFFFWLEIVWISLWVSKLVSKALPFIFQTLVGVVSSGVKKYALVIKALELPLSLMGWAVASLASFLPLMTRNPHLSAADYGNVKDWEKRVNLFLISCLISSVVFLAEKLLIQIVSVDYHRRQFSDRIQTNKQNVKFLAQLYEVSRNLFPEYTEFSEEDYIIHQGLAANIANGINIPGFNQNGGNPMRKIIGNINNVQDRIAGAFGNIAQEVTGNKNVFNPNGAYTIVLDALQRKKSSEALARRIWMSFVPEGSAALTREDLLEVMGADHEKEASDCFMSLDRDGNGDVSLDEMILHVMHIHNERFDVAKSMQDVDNAISALDNVLLFIVFVIIVLVFVISQQSSIGSVIAGAGTVLISLSFVFAATAAEVLSSCIFLFVKHPYDVGDRVDIDTQRFIVEHISLLYTVVRNVDSHKTTQYPNSLLNTTPIGNVTRSIYMQESVTVAVQYDTPFEDIQKLKDELLLFVKEHSRDYQPDLDVEIVGVNQLDKLELKIDLKHRSNWSNNALTMQRRNKFFCALVLILKRIPIYGAGGGGASLGEQAKPMFTVQLPSQFDAETNMKAAAEAKEAKRWDYKANKHDEPPLPIVTEPNTAAKLDINIGDQRSLSPFADDRGEDDISLHRKSSESRRGDFSETRGLLARASTKGRRKAVPTEEQLSPGSAQGSGYQYTMQR